MPVSYYEVKREALIALYAALNTPLTGSGGQVFWSARDLAPFVDTNATLSFIAKALMSLEEEELVESRIDPQDPQRLELYTLSDAGVLRAEELTGNVDPSFGLRSNIRTDDVAIKLDRSDDRVQKIDQALEDLEEEIRTSNEAFRGDDVSRAAALAEVRSLKALWQSGVVRIKAFQERAQSALIWVTDKSASAAIAEACKHLLKQIFGW